MPKIYIYLGIEIFFYSNEHEPIHVHGRSGDRETKAEFYIENGIIESIHLKPVVGKDPLIGSSLNDFETFLNIYGNDIVQKWVDYFVYHKKIGVEKITKKL